VCCHLTHHYGDLHSFWDIHVCSKCHTMGFSHSLLQYTYSLYMSHYCSADSLYISHVFQSCWPSRHQPTVQVCLTTVTLNYINIYRYDVYILYSHHAGVLGNLVGALGNFVSYLITQWLYYRLT
jgi:hypothetical protein